MKRPSILRSAIPALLITLASTQLLAATKTWDGGGADNNWLTGANWDLDAAPLANDSLVFGGTARINPNVNNFAANTNFTGITFASGAGSFNLSGTAANLGGDIIDNATTAQTISAPLNVLNSSRTINISDAAGSLVISSSLAGYNNSAFVKTGLGTLTLTGNNINYFGSYVVNGGTLVATAPTNSFLGRGGSIIVNNGGTLRFNTSNDPFQGGVAYGSATITINAGGLVTNGAAASGGNVVAMLPRLVLNGGELRAADVLSGYLAYEVRDVTVGGTTPSLINGTIAANVIGLGYKRNPASNIGGYFVDYSNVPFNVADVTGDSAADLTVDAVMVNAGDTFVPASLTKKGAGTMVLKKAQTYTGTSFVRNGTLALDATTGSLAAASSLNFIGTGTFDYRSAAAGSSQTFTTPLSLTTGDGTLRTTYGGAGSTALTFSALSARGAGATLNFDPSGGDLTNNRIVFTTAPTANAALGSGFFHGGQNYAAYDGTQLAVRAYNYATDAGGVTSAGGATLGAVTAASNVLLTGPVTVQSSASVNTIKIAGAQNFTLAAGQTLTVNGLLKTGGGATVLDGGAGLQSSVDTDLVLRTAAAGDAVTINANLLANGASGLTKSGPGTVTLGGGNTYTGTTTVNDGLLTLNGGGTYTGAMVVNGGTLTQTGAGNFSGAVTLAGGSLNQSSTGVYAGAGARTVDGGIFNMSGANSFTGALTVSGGLLNLPAGATSSGGGVFTLGRDGLATIAGTASVGNTNINGSLTLTGTMNVNAAGFFYVGNGLAFDRNTGLLSNNGSLQANGTLTLEAGAQLNVTGTFTSETFAIARNAAIGTVNQNGGTFDYNPTGTKNFTLGVGATTGTDAAPAGALATYNLNGGVLDLHGQTLSLAGSSNVTGTFNLNGGTLKAATVSQANVDAFTHGTFDFNGGTLQTTANSSIFSNVDFVRAQAGGAVIDTAGFSNTLAALTHEPALGATLDGGLTKKGAGTLALTGTSTYTGPTLVTAGTLSITGNIASSATTVSGGTLEGTGTVGALTLTPSGRLAPGVGGIGTLNSGAANLAGGGTFALELGAATGDQLNVAGTFSLAGTTALDITLTGDPTDFSSTFTIVNSSGGITGGGLFAYGANVLDPGEVFLVTSNSINQYFSIDYSADTGKDVVLNAVPEPASTLTLLAGLGILALRRHRRK